MAIPGLAPLASKADDPPKSWAVTGVPANDVLHMRDVPSADSQSLARIPPNARGLKHLGCRRNQPPMELWARMSETARREALTQWCRVEYGGLQGWVAGRFLKPDNGPAR
ncbi:MAG: SH3 domain-containing protein [Hyphomonadaceae bacterium]|nr:SH3 domain-containing protein [Hyphomonadaceae bacterium]